MKWLSVTGDRVVEEEEHHAGREATA